MTEDPKTFSSDILTLLNQVENPNPLAFNFTCVVNEYLIGPPLLICSPADYQRLKELLDTRAPYGPLLD